MRIVLLILAVWMSQAHLGAQETEWLRVADQQTVVSVEMPGLPKLNRQDVLVGGELVSRDIYSFRTGLMEMYFEITPVPANVYGKRTINTQFKQAVDDLAFKFDGKVRKKEKLSRDGTDYQYVELDLSSGRIVRSVLFEERGKLFHVYVAGVISQVFGIDGNYYLLNWKVGTRVTVDETDTYIPGVVSDTVPATRADEVRMAFSVPEGWAELVIDGHLAVHFPAIPFKKTTLVEFGTRQLVVEAWSRPSESYRLNYVVTKRIYGPDEGQLSDAELYEYILEKLISLEKLKWIDERTVIRPGLECREYVFSKGFRFYRLQLIRRGDTIYQVLVKGGRKNINKPEAEQFFGAIKPLN